MMEHPIEKYMLILSDTLFANLAIDNSMEIAIYSVAIFGNYNPLLVLVFALAGYTVASVLNYILGRVVFNILKPRDEEKRLKSESNINFIRGSKYLPLILLFSLVPFWGKFVPLFAGFCKVNLRLTIAICILSKLAYYCYILFI